MSVLLTKEPQHSNLGKGIFFLLETFLIESLKPNKNICNGTKTSPWDTPKSLKTLLK